MLQTGSRIATATKTFGALPFASMVEALQRSKRRKHLLVPTHDLSIP
jgi:hypothetical protein